MEDNVSSNNCLCILKHLLNHICVTEALNRPQKPVSCLSAGVDAEPSIIPCIVYLVRLFLLYVKIASLYFVKSNIIIFFTMIMNVTMLKNKESSPHS